MNTLSFRGATECENATKPKCVCRCGGTAHGARRTADVGTLPQTDPHYPAADIEERAKEARRVFVAMRRWCFRMGWNGGSR